MASKVLTDCQVFVGGYDLTGDSNNVSLELTADAVEATTFSSGGWRTRKPGLKSVTFSHQGYTGFADPDATMFADLGAERIFSVSEDIDHASVAYLFKGVRASWQPWGGAVGDMAGMQGEGHGSNGVGAVGGRLLHPKGSVTGDANGTGYQLGAVAADEKLYAAVHCFTAGTTADVIIESDDNSDFSSATTRSTTTVTAVGATWVAIDGAVADDYWRVRFANVTGTFSIGVTAGIA